MMIGKTRKLLHLIALGGEAGAKFLRLGNTAKAMDCAASHFHRFHLEKTGFPIVFSVSNKGGNDAWLASPISNKASSFFKPISNFAATVRPAKAFISDTACAIHNHEIEVMRHGRVLKAVIFHQHIVSVAHGKAQARHAVGTDKNGHLFVPA